MPTKQFWLACAVGAVTVVLAATGAMGQTLTIYTGEQKTFAEAQLGGYSSVIIGDGGVMEGYGNHAFDSITVENGGLLHVTDRQWADDHWEGGWLRLAVDDFSVHAGGEVSANASGHYWVDAEDAAATEGGVGRAEDVLYSEYPLGAPGGGAYGGAQQSGFIEINGGEVDPEGRPGGKAWTSGTASGTADSFLENGGMAVQMGSRGGNWSYEHPTTHQTLTADGGAGGGGLEVMAFDRVTINGTVSANGGIPQTAIEAFDEEGLPSGGIGENGVSGGGGSGGQLFMQGSYVIVGPSANIQTLGADTSISGGGSGGRINIIGTDTYQNHGGSLEANMSAAGGGPRDMSGGRGDNSTPFVAAPTNSMPLVAVGNPGNASDSRTGYGRVDHEYEIRKHEVTNAQYREFLNSVAAHGDPKGLYNVGMAGARGGIERIGGGTENNPYVYIAKGGDHVWDNRPVIKVSFWDALRFCNWMHNKLTGEPPTTEDGSYRLTGGGGGGVLSEIIREPGATFVLPTENEWYKAAYYDPDLNSGAGGYYYYPTGSDLGPTAELPPGGVNSASYDSVLDLPIEVGSYTDSDSPYGAFDQGGNVMEWNETVTQAGVPPNLLVGVRGGSLQGSLLSLCSTDRGSMRSPSTELDRIGFRIAKVPEPTTLALLGMGACWLGSIRIRRKT